MNAAGARPRATLDTNLAVSAAINRMGAPHQVFRLLQRGDFQPVSSTELVRELALVLSRPRIQRVFRPDPIVVTSMLTALRAAMTDPLPVDSLPVRCRDEKDDMVLACALGGNADYIVTGDSDLLVLDGNPALGTLRIVTPRGFLDLLGDAKEPGA